nr:unnamed protein product [Naegleria fowleri]
MSPPLSKQDQIAFYNSGLDVVSMLTNFHFYPSMESILIYMSAVVFCVLATLILPGKREPGAPLKDGSRVLYKTNGLSVILASILVYGLLCYYNFQVKGEAIYTFICNRFGELLTVSLVWSIILTTILYIRGAFFIPEKERNFLYPKYNIIMNFWCGVELNPHFFGFEIKEFSYRPAFAMMSVLNLSYLFEQIRLYGYPSPNLVTFQAISFFYTIDAFVFEYGMIYMFDIIEEK